jgi:hypothetical protein
MSTTSWLEASLLMTAEVGEADADVAQARREYVRGDSIRAALRDAPKDVDGLLARRQCLLAAAEAKEAIAKVAQAPSEISEDGDRSSRSGRARMRGLKRTPLTGCLVCSQALASFFQVGNNSQPATDLLGQINCQFPQRQRLIGELAHDLDQRPEVGRGGLRDGIKPSHRLTLAGHCEILCSAYQGCADRRVGLHQPSDRGQHLNAPKAQHSGVAEPGDNRCLADDVGHNRGDLRSAIKLRQRVAQRYHDRIDVCVRAESGQFLCGPRAGISHGVTPLIWRGSIIDHQATSVPYPSVKWQHSRVLRILSRSGTRHRICSDAQLTGAQGLQSYSPSREAVRFVLHMMPVASA